jgi:hypothetical protein
VNRRIVDGRPSDAIPIPRTRCRRSRADAW